MRNDTDAPSSDPKLEPSYTRASVQAYLRAGADQREQIESEIDEARTRAELARREQERLGASATATVTAIPTHAAADAATDTETHYGAGTGAGTRPAATGTDVGSNALIVQLRLTMPSEGIAGSIRRSRRQSSMSNGSIDWLLIGVAW
jgi:hypothetical protein